MNRPPPPLAVVPDRQDVTMALYGGDSVAPLEDDGLPPIWSVVRLVQDFKPIESIVDGLPIGRGNVVALTGPTGGGKTTIACLLQVALVRGLPFAGREVTQGSVLVLAGENPDDYTMHLMATMQDAGLAPDDMRCDGRHELLVIAGRFSLGDGMVRLHREVKELGRKLVAVIVDTSATFYEGQDENDNVAMLKHAAMLRELTTLPGRPTAIALCHPTKGATKDRLLPRGGGAFVAEIDANLTVWKDEAGISTLWWIEKIRGSSFEPIRFELLSVKLEGHLDCRGKAITSSVARPVPEHRVEQLENREINDQDRLLIAMRKWPGASVSDLARESGMVNAEGEPLKSKADRRLKGLESLQLAVRDRHGKWSLTPKGQKDAEALPC